MEWIDGGDHYGGAAWGMPDLDLPSVYTGLPCARSPAPGLDDVVEGSHTDYHDCYHEPWVVNPSPDFSAKSHADAANLETGTAGIHFSGMAAPPRLVLHADEGEYEAIASPTPMRAARARVTSKATPLLKYADPNHAPVLSGSAPRGALDLSRHINPEPSAASPRAKRQRRAAPKVEPEPPKARVQQPIVAHHHSKIVPPQAAAQATARALEEPVASRKKNRKPPTIPKSAAGLPMVCSYELCPNPLHTSGGTWKYVSSETRAGGRDWSPYEGMLFCNACFTQYATKGCMDRMGRQPVAGVTYAPQAEAPPASPPKRKRKRLTKASSKERKRQSSSQAPAIVERSALA